MIYKPLIGREKGVYWYILQTASAAEIAFNRYCDLLATCPELLACKPHETEKFCTLINGAKVFFKSGWNFEDLRMETLDGAIIDEYRQQPPELWPRIIRPMLSRRKGWADILSTPNGFEHFFDLFEAAKVDPEWAWFHAPSTEAWWWNPQEIASTKRSMSADEFAQEIEADFREMGVGKAYSSHGIWNQRDSNPFCSSGLWSPHLPIIVGLDFNVGVMCWELAQRRAQDWWFGDEIAMTNTNTLMQAPMLVSKVKDHPAGVILVGDASGKANKTSASGNTDYSIICEELTKAGVKFQNLTPESNPPVKDRVNSTNARLKAADGSVHLWYHPVLCGRLRTDYQRVVWKQGATGAVLDKSKADLTHASDAAGYPITLFSDQWKPKPGVTRVLVR